MLMVQDVTDHGLQQQGSIWLLPPLLPGVPLVPPLPVPDQEAIAHLLSVASQLGILDVKAPRLVEHGHLAGKQRRAAPQRAEAPQPQVQHTHDAIELLQDDEELLLPVQNDDHPQSAQPADAAINPGQPAGRAAAGAAAKAGTGTGRGGGAAGRGRGRGRGRGGTAGTARPPPKDDAELLRRRMSALRKQRARSAAAAIRESAKAARGARPSAAAGAGARGTTAGHAEVIDLEDDEDAVLEEEGGEVPGVGLGGALTGVYLQPAEDEPIVLDDEHGTAQYQALMAASPLGSASSSSSSDDSDDVGQDHAMVDTGAHQPAKEGVDPGPTAGISPLSQVDGNQLQQQSTPTRGAVRSSVPADLLAAMTSAPASLLASVTASVMRHAQGKATQVAELTSDVAQELQHPRQAGEPTTEGAAATALVDAAALASGAIATSVQVPVAVSAGTASSSPVQRPSAPSSPARAILQQQRGTESPTQQRAAAPQGRPPAAGTTSTRRPSALPFLSASVAPVTLGSERQHSMGQQLLEEQQSRLAAQQAAAQQAERRRLGLPVPPPAPPPFPPPTNTHGGLMPALPPGAAHGASTVVAGGDPPPYFPRPPPPAWGAAPTAAAPPAPTLGPGASAPAFHHLPAAVAPGKPTGVASMAAPRQPPLLASFAPVPKARSHLPLSLLTRPSLAGSSAVAPSMMQHALPAASQASLTAPPTTAPTQPPAQPVPTVSTGAGPAIGEHCAPQAAPTGGEPRQAPASLSPELSGKAGAYELAHQDRAAASTSSYAAATAGPPDWGWPGTAGGQGGTAGAPEVHQEEEDEEMAELEALAAATAAMAPALPPQPSPSTGDVPGALDVPPTVLPAAVVQEPGMPVHVQGGSEPDQQQQQHQQQDQSQQRQQDVEMSDVAEIAGAQAGSDAGQDGQEELQLQGVMPEAAQGRVRHEEGEEEEQEEGELPGQQAPAQHQQQPGSSTQTGTDVASGAQQPKRKRLSKASKPLVGKQQSHKRVLSLHGGAEAQQQQQVMVEQGLYAELKQHAKDVKKLRKHGVTKAPVRPKYEIIERPPCKFWRLGICEKGSQCKFSHKEPSAGKLFPCREWKQQGSCARGDECRLSHEPGVVAPCRPHVMSGSCTTAGCTFRHDLDSGQLLLLRDYYDFQETCKRQKLEKQQGLVLMQQQQLQAVQVSQQPTQQGPAAQMMQQSLSQVQHVPAAEVASGVDVEEI